MDLFSENVDISKPKFKRVVFEVPIYLILCTKDNRYRSIMIVSMEDIGAVGIYTF